VTHRAASALRRFLVTSALALVATAPLPARAQIGALAGHPLPEGPRPLHALVAEADAAAIGVVEAVETGRIRVRDAVALFGDPPARFELKRAPSSPPPLERGQRALLLLRGARSPYLLVGEPREQIALAGDDAATRLAPAFAEVRTALPDPDALRDLYLVWTDGDDPVLRPLGFAGLVSPGAPFVPLPAALAVPRAQSALDPGRESARRAEAAAIAILGPEGAEALLAGSPVPADPVGTQIYEMALAGGFLRERQTAVEDALARGLASPDARVRRVALRFSRGLASPRLRAAIEVLAASDPDPALKQAAAEIVGARPGGA